MNMEMLALKFFSCRETGLDVGHSVVFVQHVRDHDVGAHGVFFSDLFWDGGTRGQQAP